MTETTETPRERAIAQSQRYLKAIEGQAEVSPSLYAAVELAVAHAYEAGWYTRDSGYAEGNPFRPGQA